MKFSHALIALVATISQAQPIEDASAASHIEIVPGWKRSLDKRADCTFTVWTDANCGGTPTSISVNVGAKGNFNPKQKSVMVKSMVSGAHLSLYPDANQQPSNSPSIRLTGLNKDECFYNPSAWASYGVYNN